MLWHDLTALLNVCWEEELIPADWMDGIVLVVPLHKGGDSCDIGNYREMTGSHIGKVFCSVLNARLSEAMESKIFKEGSEEIEELRIRFFCGQWYWANKKKPRQENLDGVLTL